VTETEKAQLFIIYSIYRHFRLNYYDDDDGLTAVLAKSERSHVNSRRNIERNTVVVAKSPTHIMYSLVSNLI